jgi:D-amino-acid dehydrogenase
VPSAGFPAPFNEGRLVRVLVLGAGLAGTTTAYFLALAGCAVEVIDRGGEPATEASHGTAGLIHASLAEPWNSPETVVALLRSVCSRDGAVQMHARELPGLVGWGLRFLLYSRERTHRENTAMNARLALYSQQVLAELRTRLGLAYDDSRRGLLKVFRSSTRLNAVVRTAHRLSELGIPFEVLSASELIEREPLLAPDSADIVGGIFYPNDESGCPAKFALAIAAHAEALGVRFRYHTHVLGLERGGRGLSAVVTDRGRLTADACVIAAGPESAVLGRHLRLRMPIKPVKGYLTTFPITHEMPLPSAPLVDDGRRIAINQLGSRLRISGSAEFSGLDRSVSAAQVARVVARACATLPALTACLSGVPGEPWSCLRPMSADGLPILGATRLANVFVNSGAGHLGWTMAAGAGSLVADTVVGREPALPMAAFALGRFSR